MQTAPNLKSEHKRREQQTSLWHNIDWGEVYKTQIICQNQLVVEYRKSNIAGVYRLQREILENKHFRISAVKRVSTNKGGSTPGIDGITWKEPWQRIDAVHQLNKWVKNLNSYKAKPVARKWIPKEGSEDLRPLGIPTIFDRATQCIYYYIIDPIVEEQSDPNSFGFRKNRDPGIAIHRLNILLIHNNSSTWVYDADISKCFDRIDHNALLEQCTVFNKEPLKQWLKAGIYDPAQNRNTWGIPPNQIGTPQGGIISPMLCNVALNGLEKAIKVDKKRFNTKLQFASINRKHPDNKISLIRYADDFVILAPHKTALKLRIQIAQEFLKSRGLELSEEKSKIVTIFQGFDYLGFNLRKQKHNPYKQNAKSISKQIQVKQHGAGYTLITKPSEKKVALVKIKIDKILNKQQKHQDKDGQFLNLLLELNPIIIGWRNYYAQAYTSIWTLSNLNEWIHIRKVVPWLRKLIRNRKCKGTIKDVLNRYNKPAKNWKSRLGVKNEKGKIISLHRFYDPATHKGRSVFNKRPLPSPKKALKAQNDAYTDINPYTYEGMEWWQNRVYTEVEGNYKDRQNLYTKVCKKYNYQCGICSQPLGQDGEITELHRMKPGLEGGKYTYNNVIPVHKFCHQKLHSSLRRKSKKKKY